MSVHLKWGEIHPRTMLADLPDAGRGKAATTYRTELAWREFYADVLARRPDSAREYYRPEFARMDYDEPGEAFEAWRTGGPGSRSWTRGCDSCEPKGGCTTGSG